MSQKIPPNKGKENKRGNRSSIGRRTDDPLKFLKQRKKDIGPAIGPKVNYGSEAEYRKVYGGRPNRGNSTFVGENPIYRHPSKDPFENYGKKKSGKFAAENPMMQPIRSGSAGSTEEDVFGRKRTGSNMKTRTTKVPRGSGHHSKP